MVLIKVFLMQKPFCDLDLLSINPRFLLSSRPHKKVAAWIFIQPTILLAQRRTC